jgi:lauroyl/myristoyl acyltransferase
MQQQPATDSINTAAAGRPGEYSHYYVNLLTLFGQHKPVAEIEALARAAVANRDREIERFSTHLQALQDDFSTQAQHRGERAHRLPTPQLQGWESLGLERLRQQHGGLLIALFHYGAHRQVFSDLGAQGIGYVAPVAKQAYFDCTQMTSISPVEFEAAMGLIEVEDPRVGRTILQALRRGRIGVIYVDGNMGPDGHKVEEGGLEVDFLGQRIKVKAGIARLSHSMQFPVLPLSVRADHNNPDKIGRVVAGPLLHPRAKHETTDGDADRLSMMQSIYDFLAHEVQADASIWEFAFCLHRWVVGGAINSLAVNEQPQLLGEQHQLCLPRSEVALFERDEQQYWVHVRQQKAFRLPSWAHGLHAFLLDQKRGVGEIRQWLMLRHPNADDAHELLGGLQRRGLLAIA